MTTFDFDFGDGRGPVPAHRHRNPDGSEGGWVADSATVDPTCTIPPTALVGAWCVLGARVVLGAGCDLGARVVLGAGCDLGAGCRLEDWVRLGPDAHLRTTRDAARIGPVGSRDDYLTAYRHQDGSLRYSTGCRVGVTYAEFLAACAATHGGGSRHYTDYGYAATALWRLVMGDAPIPEV